MNNLFLLLFLLSFFALILGIVKPTWVIRWGDPENRKRKTVLKTYLTSTIIFFFLFGFTIDPQQASQAQKRQQETEKVVQTEQNPSEEKPSQEQQEPKPTQQLQQPQPPQQSGPKKYTGDGPNGEGIKGNISKKGEKIYHLPGGSFYNRTHAEVWFFTEQDARAAGYRPSER